MPTSRQWLLNGHPRGRGIEDGDFQFVQTEIGGAGEGELLLKTLYLGFDPAQRKEDQALAVALLAPQSPAAPRARPSPRTLSTSSPR